VSTYSSLDAVSSAVYTTLNVAALTALAPGGVGDAIEQRTGFPYVLYEVQERVVGGLGSKPGTGKRTLEVDLRVHVFSQYVGMIEAQQVMAKCIELLADAPVVTGYGSWAIFHDGTVPLPGEIVAGVVVNELVANMRLMVSEA
jgi:hypothetical protein